MLLDLRAENYAVIDHAIAQFGTGLNLMTGETGAGKSILIDALELLLGGKASVDLIRHGAEKATVGCVFELTPGALEILEASGIDPEGDEIVLRREIAASPKGRVYVNSRRPAGDGRNPAAACTGAGAGPLAGRDHRRIRRSAAAASAGPLRRADDRRGRLKLSRVARHDHAARGAAGLRAGASAHG